MPCDPATLCTEELDNRRNVFHIRQPIPHCTALVERHRVSTFLQVEKRRVHWSRTHRVHADHLGRELLANAAGEVLDRGLGARVGGVKSGEGCEEGCHDCDYLATLVDVFGGLLEDEEGGFRAYAARGMLERGEGGICRVLVYKRRTYDTVTNGKPTRTSGHIPFRRSPRLAS